MGVDYEAVVQSWTPWVLQILFAALTKGAGMRESRSDAGTMQLSVYSPAKCRSVGRGCFKVVDSAGRPTLYSRELHRALFLRKLLCCALWPGRKAIQWFLPTFGATVANAFNAARHDSRQFFEDYKLVVQATCGGQQHANGIGVTRTRLPSGPSSKTWDVTYQLSDGGTRRVGHNFDTAAEARHAYDVMAVAERPTAPVNDGWSANVVQICLWRADDTFDATEERVFTWAISVAAMLTAPHGAITTVSCGEPLQARKSAMTAAELKQRAVKRKLDELDAMRATAAKLLKCDQPAQLIDDGVASPLDVPPMADCASAGFGGSSSLTTGDALAAADGAASVAARPSSTGVPAGLDDVWVYDGQPFLEPLDSVDWSRPAKTTFQRRQPGGIKPLTPDQWVPWATRNGDGPLLLLGHMPGPEGKAKLDAAAAWFIRPELKDSNLVVPEQLPKTVEGVWNMYNLGSDSILPIKESIRLWGPKWAAEAMHKERRRCGKRFAKQMPIVKRLLWYIEALGMTPQRAVQQVTQDWQNARADSESPRAAQPKRQETAKADSEPPKAAQTARQKAKAKAKALKDKVNTLTQFALLRMPEENEQLIDGRFYYHGLTNGHNWQPEEPATRTEWWESKAEFDKAVKYWTHRGCP